MNENETKKPENKQCQCKGDLRTFVIAFLTSVILLALYHFGTGLCAIMSGTSDYGCMPVTREYVLVPVSSLPPAVCPGMGGHRDHFRGPGEEGFRKGSRGMKDGKFRRKGKMNPFRNPEGPAPEDAPVPKKAPAPEAK